MSSDWVAIRDDVIDIFKDALKTGWDKLSDNAKQQIEELVTIAADIEANKDNMDVNARKQLLENHAEAVKNVILADNIIAQTILINAINDAISVILQKAPGLLS